MGIRAEDHHDDDQKLKKAIMNKNDNCVHAHPSTKDHHNDQ
jgi:hypothetical protein